MVIKNKYDAGVEDNLRHVLVDPCLPDPDPENWEALDPAALSPRSQRYRKKQQVRSPYNCLFILNAVA